MLEEYQNLDLNEEQQVEDEASQDDIVAPIRYEISSYGADYDVEGLVKRLNRGDILVPSFQRNYVWNQAEASRFIESLLLGLPTPAIFLARESDSNKLLVIDGQQRLKTLQFFYNGYFNPQIDEKREKVFKLLNVQPEFESLTYEKLDENDKIKLNDSLIHAIIIKQDSPQRDNTSIYHIFDRLNSEGRSLNPQEIRSAVDHGEFIDMIRDLNEYENWRKIYGKKNSRLKDQELIMRFLAFYFDIENYQRPMKEFLNRFSQKHRHADTNFLKLCRKLFTSTIDIVFESIGQKAFRPIRAINAAVFDSVMVAIARRRENKPNSDFTELKQAYDELLKDPEYTTLLSSDTSDEQKVENRFKKATEKLNNILDA
ncbi:MAG: DUF262 domain-containing protein [Calothrix sp. MO_167.B42]|nr:DUF262 domain-containing protein [Calothrix sp. MO_167.B42]